MLEKTEATLRESGVDGKVEALAADAGYFRDDLDIESMEKEGPELLICTKKSHKWRSAWIGTGGGWTHFFQAEKKTRPFFLLFF